jgi:hypothetical protein
MRSLSALARWVYVTQAEAMADLARHRWRGVTLPPGEMLRAGGVLVFAGND